MKNSGWIEALDHVGIVVEDLESVSSALEEILGVSPERRVIDDAQLEARVFDVSGVAVEVLRFVRSIERVDPSVFHAGAGIQHLAFRVSDLACALGRLRAQGIEPLLGFPRAGVHGKIAFFREPATGLLFELVERNQWGVQE